MTPAQSQQELANLSAKVAQALLTSQAAGNRILPKDNVLWATALHLGCAVKDQPTLYSLLTAVERARQPVYRGQLQRRS